MTTFSFAVPIKPKCVYKPYNGKLGGYLTVYLEMHDSRHREESFQNRMKMIKEAGVEAGMELSEEELDQVAGGIKWPWK